MTLTEADSREATVESDPVRALMGADRDGLLAYHGFVSGGGYEVDVAGRRRIVPAAEVVDFVERLRAVERVAAVQAGTRLVELRDDGTHVVEIAGHSAERAGRRVELAAGRVVDWSAGFVAAYAGQGQEHAGDDQLAEIAQLIEQPGRDDQCRMVILGLMYGRGDDRVSTDRLVEMIGALPDVAKPPAKKTVVDALAFGQYLGSDMAEKLIAAFGLPWRVTAGDAAEGGSPAGPMSEMPGMAALRRIVVADRAGWLRYVDEPSPNKARWKPERDRFYRLTVGGQRYVIGADSLDAWLDGMAEFHTG